MSPGSSHGHNILAADYGLKEYDCRQLTDKELLLKPVLSVTEKTMIRQCRTIVAENSAIFRIYRKYIKISNKSKYKNYDLPVTIQ